MHRADLLDVLVGAARHAPNILLHRDAKIRCFSQDDARTDRVDGGRRLRWGRADRRRRPSTRSFAPVSGVAINPGSPVVSRGVPWFPAAGPPPDRVRPMATLWWGPGGHFVHYYVRRGELVNCVGIVEKTGWEVESWTARGEHAEFAADFAGWHDDIQCLIDNADRNRLFKWALHDREPMPRWGKGRVTLLGDGLPSDAAIHGPGSCDGNRGCRGSDRMPGSRR